MRLLPTKISANRQFHCAQRQRRARGPRELRLGLKIGLFVNCRRAAGGADKLKGRGFRTPRGIPGKPWRQKSARAAEMRNAAERHGRDDVLAPAGAAGALRRGAAAARLRLLCREATYYYYAASRGCVSSFPPPTLSRLK